MSSPSVSPSPAPGAPDKQALVSDSGSQSPRSTTNGHSSPRLNGTHQEGSFHHKPPSEQSLLASLDPRYFEDDFDEKAEAITVLSSDDAADSASIISSIFERVEKIDLARDAVSHSLGDEVRHSAGALLSGMRQVQDLDLDVTRAILHVVAVRRRLGFTKRDLIVSRQRITRLSNGQNNRTRIKETINTLVNLNRRLDECNSIINPLSARARATLSAIEVIEDEYPLELKAVSSSLLSLRKRLTIVETEAHSNLETILRGPQFDQPLYEDVLLTLHSLGKNSSERLAVVSAVWSKYLETTITLSQVRLDKSSNVPTHFQDQGPSNDEERGVFSQVLDSCKAFARSLDENLLKDVSADEISLSKKEALAFLAKLVDDYLKNPLVRSQALEDFSKTINDASRIVESMDVLFGEFSSSQEQSSRTKMESSIRLRARVYAQQYQAEGFQAMRGLVWRELWVDVAGSDNDFIGGIFTRLGVTPPSQESLKGLALTATVASGLPRQIQRTLDLMKKLPISAAGEAFLGLLRVVDLYLVAVLTVFVPSWAFLDSKRFAKSVQRNYIVQATDGLKEWLVSSSPRASALGQQRQATSPRGEGTSSGDEGEILLCEMDFKRDETASFETALVGASSLGFLVLVLTNLEKRLSDLLPAIERAKMASKLFVDVPSVVECVKQLVHRAAGERLIQQVRMPQLDFVYEGAEGGTDGSTQFSAFRESISQIQTSFLELQTNPRLSDHVKAELWDEACACFLDRYLDGIACLPQCSPMDRGNMILHLASMWEALLSLPGSKSMLSSSQGRATKTKTKVDDYIKAFYYDKAPDLWDWMRKRKDEFEPHHYLAVLNVGLVGQNAGPEVYVTGANGTSRAVGARKELRQEFERVLATLYT